MKDAVTALAGIVGELGRSWARPDLLHERDSSAHGSAELRQTDLWSAGGSALLTAQEIGTTVTVSPVTDFTFSSASIASCDGRDTVTEAELAAVRRSYLAEADPAPPFRGARGSRWHRGHGGRLRGWAGYLITGERGTQVLIDPYLAGAEGFHGGLAESPVTPDELSGCDIVTVTHAGYDHRGQVVEITAAGQAILVCVPALCGTTPLIAELAAADTHIDVAVLEFGQTWTAGHAP